MTEADAKGPGPDPEDRLVHADEQSRPNRPFGSGRSIRAANLFTSEARSVHYSGLATILSAHPGGGRSHGLAGPLLI